MLDYCGFALFDFIAVRPPAGVSEAMNGPGPCNGYPDYKDMPINQAFYLGAHNAQASDISQALDEGKFL